jgi:hypothetical protein
MADICCNTQVYRMEFGHMFWPDQEVERIKSSSFYNQNPICVAIAQQVRRMTYAFVGGLNKTRTVDFFWFQDN